MKMVHRRSNGRQRLNLSITLCIIQHMAYLENQRASPRRELRLRMQKDSPQVMASFLLLFKTGTGDVFETAAKYYGSREDRKLQEGVPITCGGVLGPAGEVRQRGAPHHGHGLRERLAVE